MRSHLERLAQFLARLRADQLCEIASLYDPSQPAARLAFRKILSSPQSQSFLSCSVSSLSSTSSEILDFVQGDEGTVTEEDMMKFFIFVLLLLNHKRGSRKFDMKLLQSDFRYPEEEEADIVDMKLRPEILVPKEEPFGLWFSSCRTGHGEEEEDVCLPQQVRQFETLRVKVLTVACGLIIPLLISGVLDIDNSRGYEIIEQHMENGMRNLLMIHKAQSEDFGLYNCSVWNEYGHDSVLIHLKRQG
ncbi:uncharacterized protein LOC143233026 [Tachypleus tridentatus]|uniref:uncharacterized protein LOC143233026 n=1 Tax=Tachypleus tridentatus TaxID=6853 RepID=UPI003FD41269